MFQACGEFLDLAQRQEKNFLKVVDHERAQRIRLEQTVEDLAKQHNFLEEACRERVVPKHKTVEKTTGQEPAMTAGSPSIQQNIDASHDSSDDETEFFDAEDLIGMHRSYNLFCDICNNVVTRYQPHRLGALRSTTRPTRRRAFQTKKFLC